MRFTTKNHINTRLQKIQCKRNVSKSRVQIIHGDEQRQVDRAGRFSKQDTQIAFDDQDQDRMKYI